MKYTLQLKEPGEESWRDFHELCEPKCDGCTAWVTDCDPAFGQTYDHYADRCDTGSPSPVQNDWSEDGVNNLHTATLTDKCDYLDESGELRVYEAAAGRRPVADPPHKP